MKLIIPIIVTILMSVFGAVAQVLFKKAMPLDFTPQGLFTNYYLIIGFVLYGIAFVGYLLVLRYANVSVLYPLIALSYVWIMFLALWFLKEPITKFNLIGSVLIVCGVGLIAIKGGN